MADIFEIVGIDATVKVPTIGKEYKLRDPDYLEKIKVMKEYRKLNEERESLDLVEVMERDRKLGIRYVKLYLPDLTDEDVKKMGEHTFKTLHNGITEMAAKHFGAHVRKVDEKKDPATT